MSFTTETGTLSNLKTLRFLFFQLTVVLTILTSCVGTRHLAEDEKLLFKQKMAHGKNFDSYTLSELYLRESNTRFPPYAVIYQWGLRSYDSTKYTDQLEAVNQKYNPKIEAAPTEVKQRKLRDRLQKKITRIEDKLRYGNTLMQWGEPLAIYDSMMVEQTRSNIANYIFNQGYFKGDVSKDIKFKGSGKYKDRKVSVKYVIQEGDPYLIDTLFYRTTDSTILTLLQQSKSLSLVQKGDRYNQKQLVNERERIEFYLKDHGYFNFSRQFITFDLDTANNQSDRGVSVRINVNNPTKGGHKQFQIDSVNLVINPSYRFNSENKDVTHQEDGIVFSFYEDIFSQKMLSRRIHIRQDSLYSRSATLSTQRQLANLDNFKFINVNYDSSGGRFIANIFTSPLDRYQWSHELGVNVTQGFPGPFYNLSFKKRNIFRGLENFEVNGRYGIEGVATPGDADGFYENKELGGNIGLTFPQFIVPFGVKLSNALGSVNPKTRLLAGYTDTDRFDYRRENINFSNTLSWEGKNNSFFSWEITDLSIINTIKLSSDFRNILEQQNSRLINSFLPSFVSNMSFSYHRNEIGGGIVPDNTSRYFRVQAESGGTLLNIAGTNALERQDLEYFQYIRTEFDWRRSRPITKASSIAYRLNIGFAVPYGPNKALPYEKYFFAGGSNGIRAWRPRRLGPGNYTPVNDNGAIQYNVEQQGEMIIQAGFEYRRDLIGFTEYALFIDAGNIWVINDGDSRVGARFNPADFYKQIAVGTGIGLRFDFSFLILRFDTGIKTIDPARPEGKRFLLSKNFFDPPFDDIRTTELIVFNIGVGYPF